MVHIQTTNTTNARKEPTISNGTTHTAIVPNLIGTRKSLALSSSSVRLRFIQTEFRRSTLHFRWRSRSSCYEINRHTHTNNTVRYASGTSCWCKDSVHLLRWRCGGSLTIGLLVQYIAGLLKPVHKMTARLESAKRHQKTVQSLWQT